MSVLDVRQWEVERAAHFVRQGGYKRVALQLPDELLGPAPQLVVALSSHLESDVTLAVLADTAYNPEAVDEVAAQHMAADCVIHYGRASLVNTCSLPVLHIFPKSAINVMPVAQAITQRLCSLEQAPRRPSSRVLVLLLDQSLAHATAELDQAVQDNIPSQGWRLVVAEQRAALFHPGHAGAGSTGGDGTRQGSTIETGTRATSSTPERRSWQDIPAAHDVAGYSWHEPQPTLAEHGAGPGGDMSAVYCWVGPPDTPALQALQMSLSGATWLRVDVESRVVEEGLVPGALALFKRRRFLVEKTRQASIMGVLVSTLASAGLEAALHHLRSLIRAAGKRSYTVLVGKPNPAKLANFPEVEVWVQLSDPLGSQLDSRPFMAPLITPHEAVLALTGGVLQLGVPSPLGLAPLLPGQGLAAEQLRAAAALCAPAEGDGDGPEGDKGAALAMAGLAGLGLQVSSQAGQRSVVKAAHGAEFLAMRTWKGVEAPVAGADIKVPAAAVEGMSGRAAGYAQEGAP